MSTPAQPSWTACAVRRTVSVSAQHPVPGIMRAVSRPAATSASSSSMRSLTDCEFASLLVPNTASPTCCDSNQRQCAIKRSGSGLRSVLNGVTTGASTPFRRVVACMTMCLLVMLKYLLSSFARLLELGAVQLDMPLWQKAGRDTRASYVQRGRALTLPPNWRVLHTTISPAILAGAAPGCCALLMAPAKLVGDNQPYAVPPASLAG